jgi:hypothetical protein
MSQTDQKRSTKDTKPSQSPSREGNPFITGLMIGLILGVGLCSGIAIWIARSPSPFTNRALQTMGIMKGAGLQSTTNNVVEVESSTPNPGTSNSGDSTPPSPNPNSPSRSTLPLGTVSTGAANISNDVSPVLSSGSTDSSKPNPAATLYVQVGAFSTQEEAQKQVEAVAQLTGIKARIWPSAPSDSSKVFYRVRLGAFTQTSDTNELTQILKSNGFSFVLVRPTAGEAPQ